MGKRCGTPNRFDLLRFRERWCDLPGAIALPPLVDTRHMNMAYSTSPSPSYSTSPSLSPSPQDAGLPVLPPARHVAHREHGGGGASGFASAYYTVGEKGRPALVLCHGLAANGLQFVADAHWFAERGFHVIVPDLRGHGRSTYPASLTDADFTLTRLAADLVDILDAEGIRTTHWVGNSLGGIMGLVLMRDHPGRLDHFVSFGTAFRLKTPVWGIRAFKAIYRLVGVRNLARLAGRMISPNPHTRAVVRAMALDMNIEVITHLLKALGNYDLRQAARNSGSPMLMIRGERDSSINRALKNDLPAMEKLDNFHSVLLEDAGHCANLDQPDEVRRIISEFLASRS